MTSTCAAESTAMNAESMASINQVYIESNTISRMEIEDVVYLAGFSSFEELIFSLVASPPTNPLD